MTTRLKMLAVASIAALLVLGVGCTTNSQSPQDDPTTRAMADPMGYSPNDHQDISGGGLSNFDRDEFKKDMDHVLNP